MRKKKISIFVCLVMIATVFAVAIPVSVGADYTSPEGLVSYWKFEEGGGTTAYDETTNDNDGILGGDGLGTDLPTWTTGKVGGALSFDGSNDYIEVPDNPGLTGMSELTVEAWVYPISLTSMWEGIVVKRDDYQYPSQSYLLFIRRSWDMQPPHPVIQVLNDNAELGQVVCTDTVLSTNNWYHLVGVYTGEAVQLYVNGILCGETPFVGGNINNAPHRLIIGAFGYFGSENAHFKGLIDEVAIYNRALALEEIEQHYQNGLEGKGYCYVPLEVESITGPIDPVKVNTEVQMTGTFHGSEASDTYTATWDWGDETESDGSVSDYTVTDSHTYTEAGVFTITLTVTDDDDGSDSMTYQYVVVYDPEGEFVTGGGWIDSIAGAYVADPDCPEGMVSYWKFDEGGGTIAYDSVGENHGTLINGPTWTSGIVDGALDFDGFDDIVEVINSPSLQFTEQMSIEAWFFVPEITSDDQAIACMDGSYSLYGIHDASGGLEFDQSFFIIINGWHKPYATTIGLGLFPELSQWHHIVGTYDGSESKIFIDGILRHSVQRNGDIDQNNNPLIIGRRWDETNWFDGKFDEMAVYNRALTPGEIQQHYDNGLEGKGYCNVVPLVGKASFGFVAKYKKGASEPIGNTEFKFEVADLDFHSTHYEWLVIAGAKAQFKGTGTINDEGEYKFKLWATDGALLQGGGADKFRIKIWEEDEFGVETVIYDNKVDTELGGGQIKIHKE